MGFRKVSIIKYILCVGLIILPLFYWPKASIPFEIPKVYFVQRWIEILTVLALIVNFNKSREEKIDKVLLILVLIFFTAAILASYFGVNWEKSLLGNYYRGDGLVTLGHLIGLYLLTLLFFRKSWLRSLSFSISLGSLLTSIWVIISATQFYVLRNPTVPNWEGGFGVSFGNPNFLAGYLVVTLPFIFYYLTGGNKNKPIGYSAFALQITAILLTKASAGVLGILLFLIFTILSRPNKYKGLLLIITFAVFTIFSFFVIKQLKNQNIAREFAAEGRERIIRKGLLAFGERPILGWGWSNFDYAFDSVVWPIKIEKDVYVDKAHSHFMEILVTTGLVGFLIYISVIGKGAINIFKNKEIINPFLLVFLLFVFHSQTNIISIAEEVVFWITLGVASKK